MAPRDAAKVQLDFPQLTADLIAALNLTGTLGLLELSDLVTPVFLIGSRGIVFGVENPVFGSAGISSGTALNPAANTIVADTGVLPDGDYDIAGNIAFAGSMVASNSAFVLEHRNAANNATLATLLSLTVINVASNGVSTLPVTGYKIGLNERLRLRTWIAAFTGAVSGSIMVQIRPTP